MVAEASDDGRRVVVENTGRKVAGVVVFGGNKWVVWKGGGWELGYKKREKC